MKYRSDFRFHSNSEVFGKYSAVLFRRVRERSKCCHTFSILQKYLIWSGL